ncbi:MAG: GDSL-type esterase/lipase family protein [Rikenellaceae bacterium]
MIRVIRESLLLIALIASCAQLVSAAEKITPSEIVTFKQTPTSELKLHIFYPEGHTPNDTRPVVVSFFGGGWSSGTASQFYQQSLYYNSLGMVAVSAEYRVKNRDKTTPFEAVMDGKSAIRWVRANAQKLGIDPERIVASGGSAGGHVASCTSLIETFNDPNDPSLDVSSKPNAMMLFNPVVDTSEDGYGKGAFNGDELTLSPTHHVRANLPPSIVFHGTQDRTVPFANGVQFVKAMVAADNNSRLVWGFGEPHSFFNGSYMSATNADRNFDRTMYECTKFLIEIGFIDDREVKRVEEPIRIACVGDATTCDYPKELTTLLGDAYRVESFCYDGATILEGKNNKAFIDSDQFEELLDYAPDVIVMILGGNDSKASNWTTQEDFYAKYMQLVNQLKANKVCKPEIFACFPLPISQHGDDAINNELITSDICPMIKKVGQSIKTFTPDTFSPFDPQQMPSAKELATRLYNEIGAVAVANAELKVNKRPLNSDTFDGVLHSSQYHEMRMGLRNSQQTFIKNKRGTVAFVGGSITYNPGWRDLVCEYLESRFPDTEFTFIAAGISSEGSTSAAFRLDRDVLSHGKIDLLFEEAAVNDREGGELRTTSETRQRGMEGIIRQVRKNNPKADIVVMNFVDPQKMAAYTEGEVPLEIADFEAVAEHYGVPSINLAKEVTDRIAAGEFTWKDDFKNLHPSPFGQRVYARSMTALLDSAYDASSELKGTKSYKMPKPLDKYCFDEAQFVPITAAKLASGWSIDESWRPSNGQSMRDINDLYLEKPVLIATDKAAELTLEFTGSTIGIVALSGADAGRIVYTIDGVEYAPYDLMTGNSLAQYLPRYFTLASGLDHNKSHTLKLTLAESANPRSKGNSCKIASFYINGKGTR